jgi:sigma-B regulation protein RsbU (phosphoserine phosphatase)
MPPDLDAPPDSSDVFELAPGEVRGPAPGLPPGDPNAPPPRWREADLSDNPRVGVMADASRALSRADDSKRLIDEFVTHMRRAFGRRLFIALSTEGLEEGQFRFMRVLTEEGRDLVCPKAYWDDPTKIPVRTGGLLARITREDRPRLLLDVIADVDPVLGALLDGHRSVLALPVHRDGAVIGWTILADRGSDVLTPELVDYHLIRSNMFHVYGRTMRISDDLRSAKARLDREVERIARIQRAFMPREKPQIPGVSLQWDFRMHDRAGGDYLRFLRFPASDPAARPGRDDTWGILIADAAGHGPSASVLTAMVHALANSIETEPVDPAEPLEFLNRTLQKGSLDGTFVTALFALYEPRTRRFRWASAGHPPIMFKSMMSGATRALDAESGFPLGIMPSVEAKVGEITLEVGDTLLFLTDGILDSESPEGEIFGSMGLRAAMSVCSGDPDCVIQTIRARLIGFERGRPPEDDQTMLALQITGNGEE